MDNEFEKIYEWTNEKLKNERMAIKEYKNEIRQSEGLIIGIIILCLVIAFFAPTEIAKYIFITVAVLMFIFCTIYTFRNERKITARQNKYSEYALSELAVHIKDGFVYDKNEEILGSYYRKSGFNRIYKELESHGVISGTKDGHTISISNIMVKSETEELFRGIFGYATLNTSINEIDIMRVNSKNNKKEKYQIPNQEMFIYAENMKEARQVINEGAIQYIEDFMKATDYKLELMVNNNLAFFRFFDQDILTKPLTNDKETKEFLHKYYRIIEFIAGFVDIIDK